MFSKFWIFKSPDFEGMRRLYCHALVPSLIITASKVPVAK